jgi:hypothetical protein
MELSGSKAPSVKCGSVSGSSLNGSLLGLGLELRNWGWVTANWNSTAETPKLSSNLALLSTSHPPSTSSLSLSLSVFCWFFLFYSWFPIVITDLV